MENKLTAKIANEKTKENLTKLVEEFGNSENCSKLMEEIQLQINKGKFSYRVLVECKYLNLLDHAIAYLNFNGFTATEEIEKVNLGQGCSACDKKFLNVKW
jgi:hypothetical protein